MTCPHCNVTNRNYFEIGGPEATQPREGCRGVCMVCHMWWEYQGGQLVKYTPTDDERIFAVLVVMRRRITASVKAGLN